MKIGKAEISSLRYRLVAVALLIYQFVFFVLILPGHTRGAVTLDGTHQGEPSCCMCGMSGHRHGVGKSHPSAPSGRDRENCALCSFAASVVPATSLSVDVPKLGLLGSVPEMEGAIAAFVERIATYESCGPPLGRAAA